jgi:hypothetical protein
MRGFSPGFQWPNADHTNLTAKQQKPSPAGKGSIRHILKGDRPALDATNRSPSTNFRYLTTDWNSGDVSRLANSLSDEA